MVAQYRLSPLLVLARFLLRGEDLTVVEEGGHHLSLFPDLGLQLLFLQKFPFVGIIMDIILVAEDDDLSPERINHVARHLDLFRPCNL